MNNPSAITASDQATTGCASDDLDGTLTAATGTVIARQPSGEPTP